MEYGHNRIKLTSSKEGTFTKSLWKSTWATLRSLFFSKNTVKLQNSLYLKQGALSWLGGGFLLGFFFWKRGGWVRGVVGLSFFFPLGLLPAIHTLELIKKDRFSTVCTLFRFKTEQCQKHLEGFFLWNCTFCFTKQTSEQIRSTFTGVLKTENT